MRQVVVFVGLLGVACAGPGGVPVVVHGEGATDLVISVRELRAAVGAAPGCWRAVDAADRRELRRRVGGVLADLPLDDVGDQLVVVVRSPGERLSRIEVATEEGVDVLTLSVRAADEADAAAAEPSLWLLRLERRPNQLAVVVRGDMRQGEQTVGIFDGLP